MRPHSFDENNSLVYIAGCIREVSCVILDRIDDSVLQINTTGIVAAEITYRLFVWWGILNGFPDMTFSSSFAFYQVQQISKSFLSLSACLENVTRYITIPRPGHRPFFLQSDSPLADRILSTMPGMELR